MKNEETLQCKVSAFNFSPKGGVEGLLVVADGHPAQVVFPHETGTEVAKSITVGQSLSLTVETEPASPKGEPAHAVYRFIAMTSDKKTDKNTTTHKGAISGKVERLNYARHGEANGVVLDTGDFIHLKPDGMRKIDLKVGDHVDADGKVHPMELGGRVVDATIVNGIHLNGKH